MWMPLTPVSDYIPVLYYKFADFVSMYSCSECTPES